MERKNNAINGVLWDTIKLEVSKGNHVSYIVTSSFKYEIYDR